ncbi:LPS-assembly protein LptD [Candidatus Omnitrophota bacterium]
MTKLPKFKFWLLITGVLVIVLSLGSLSSRLNTAYGQEEKRPITIDGDTVEYSADAQEVTAEGNVVIDYGNVRLTCDKITVNTQTKDAEAVGNVRLRDARGVLQAEKIVYNFDQQTGDIIEGRLRSSPYYYAGRNAKRISDNEYVVEDGYFSTCNYDHPHFRVKSKRIEIYPGNKIVARSNRLYWREIPLFGFPTYSHSLKDKFMKVQVRAGKTSNWGPYLLSGWRTDLNENARLRLYFDWRERLGTAEGLGVNYNTKVAGTGDFLFYYTNERPTRQDGSTVGTNPSSTLQQEFQRYLIRLRHTWDIDKKTKLTAQYYRIEDDRIAYDSDADFLRDYFYREYEKDAQPKSYLLIAHNEALSDINMLVQKRTNRWYDMMTEKLPEISYNLHNFPFYESPLYFKNESKFSNLTVKNPLPTTFDSDVVRLDSYNQFTLPWRVAFIDASPYLGFRQTVYSKDNQGASLSPRTIFYTGMDMSAKFYRIFNDRLRHVISPKIRYSYVHEPTVSPSKLQDFGDGIDTIDGDNRFSLELENKLQGKRDEQTVDLAIFRVSTDYIMYSKMAGLSKSDDRFTDFLFDLELEPFAWLRMEADATYDHRHDYFKTANVDTWLTFNENTRLGLGHRYDRFGGKEMTGHFRWRINPKWAIRIYERYQFASSRGKGLKEQEYTISRDLHCATIDFTFNRRKKRNEKSESSFMCVFNLKIFKESQFDYVQSYHPPKSQQ